MDTLLVLLGLVSLIAMVVGLIKPGLVIRWGEKKTRPRVLMVYGGLFIVLLIVLGMTGTSNSEKTASKAVTKAEESQTKPAKEATSKESEMKFSYVDAEKRVSDWLGDHEFPNSPSLSLSSGTADKSLYEVDGKKYHMIVLKGLQRAVDVLVDPHTGEMFFYDTGIKPQSLDKWYVEYRASHKTNIQANNRINESFEWVEKPSVQNGYIVGKVKNISNKTFKNAFIEFNLSDASNNRIGTAGAQIRNLKPGDLWNFSVSLYMYQSNVASYKLEKVEGYDW